MSKSNYNRIKKARKRKVKNIIRDNQAFIRKRAKAEPSVGEREIMKILDKSQIRYVRELSVEGLYNPDTLRPLFFDFYLPDYRTVIEFDGPHHYKPIKGEKELSRQCKKDRIKNEFCAAQDVKMLRIPYFTKSIEGAILRFFDKHFPIRSITPANRF